MKEIENTNRVSQPPLAPGAGVIPPPTQAKLTERKKTLLLLISSAERHLQFLNRELNEIEKQNPEKPRRRTSKRDERFLKYYNKIR
jgi:hypothetical protein